MESFRLCSHYTGSIFGPVGKSNRYNVNSAWGNHLSDVAGIVKPECCTYSQGKGSKQNRWDNVAEYSSKLNMLQHVADIGDTWLHVKPSSPSVAEQLSPAIFYSYWQLDIL